MKYIERNGFKLSNMTLGTSQIGFPYGVANTTGWPGLEQSFDMLHFALENGVTSLDTARGYGESEERIGKFFSGSKFAGSMPYITTKLRIGLGTNRPGGVILSPGELDELATQCISEYEQWKRTIIDTIEMSLSQLGLSKVNCIMLHDPIEMLAGGSVLAKVMGELVTKGYTDEVGVSVYQPSEVDAMLQYDEFSATQLPFNLFDQKMIHSGSLKKLKEKNYVVFVRSVFLQGLFFLDPEELDDPLLIEHAAPHIRTLRQLAYDEGVSIAQLAISFVRDTEGVTSLVLGCETNGQIAENIELISGPEISKKTMEAARTAFPNLAYEEIMTVLRRPKVWR